MPLGLLEIIVTNHMEKRLIVFILGLLLLVGCTNQSAQSGMATDTCAVAVVDTVVPVYQQVEAIDLGLSVLWADTILVRQNLQIAEVTTHR